MNKNHKHPHADWPWWKIAGVALFSFSGFGFIFASIPPISLCMFILGGISALLATIIAIWDWKVHTWISQLCLTSLWTLQLLTTGIRAWVFALPIIFVYPMVVGYLFAWTLPALYPEISKVLWREQTAPETRLGKILLGLSISLAPVAGALGASLGMFTSRFQGSNGLYLVVGPSFIILSIVFAFAFAYQLWPDRPWAGSRTETKGST